MDHRRVSKSARTISSLIILGTAAFSSAAYGQNCPRGTRPTAQGCIRIQVPANASVDYTGRNWECNRGYRQSGDKCVGFSIPANAAVDYTGRNWECNRGFKTAGSGCTPMTDHEMELAREREQESLRRLQEARADLGGDDCRTEYDTESRFCISATDASLDCQESYGRSHYQSCEVEIEYEIRTDFEGEDSFSISIECEAEVGYRSDGSHWSSDSEDESESHMFYSSYAISGEVDVDFSFSSYQEITQVRLDSVECEITNVLHY